VWALVPILRHASGLSTGQHRTVALGVRPRCNAARVWGRRFVGETMSVHPGLILGGVASMMSYGLYNVGQFNIERRSALIPAPRHTPPWR